jgi:hypothetical protein
VRIRVWVIVDMEYKPRPIPVDASANRDAMRMECERRNVAGRPARFKVYTCSGEVSIAGRPRA